MFWILRRTGAANFFNSLNNNCSTSKANNNNSTQDKYVKRPPRKAYGRLSADSDDGTSMKHKIDDPFDDLENFEMITSASCSSNGNLTVKTTLSNVCAHNTSNKTKARKNDANGSVGVCGFNGCTSEIRCGSTDCQGNFVNGDLCDLNMGLCGRALASGSVNDMGMSKSKSATITATSTTAATIRQKEVNENTINRLHAMAMSDDDDYDESLTCNVCDRAFHCHRQLASHQQKKRHFGCSGCDSLFPSLMLLEHHKEEFEHWSDDEIGERVCCRRNRGDDYFTDTDSYTSEAESEDLERLL